MAETPSIVVIGGGTGTSTLLSELKYHTPNISAIVNMSDDGGSSGVLRKQYGVLPPGDIRQCLVALHNNPDQAAYLNTRLPDGHTPGNILLAEIEQASGSFIRGIDYVSKLLRITGTVHPATTTHHDLAMQDGDSIIFGESEIGHRVNVERTPRIWLRPPAPLHPAAGAAIESADTVVIAPGNLYGSVLPALAVHGIKDALTASRAQKIMVTNLVNQPGQTDGWHVSDHREAIETYAGSIDLTLYNCEPPAKLGVLTDRVGPRAIGAPLIAKTALAPHKSNDHLALKPRNTVRHDAAAIADLIMKVL